MTTTLVCRAWISSLSSLGRHIPLRYFVLSWFGPGGWFGLDLLEHMNLAFIYVMLAAGLIVRQQDSQSLCLFNIIQG